MTAGSPTVYPIPPPNADFATTWAFLKEGLDHIMTEPQTGMSYHKYMALSTASYNYCISPDPVPGRADVNGSDLYKSLVGFLVTHLRTLKDASEHLQDEALLRYYVTEWDRYTKVANYINRLFTYLNREWVKSEMDAGRKGIYPVYTLCLVQWKINFFIPIQNNSKLTGAMLRLIEHQRNGQEIDQGLVKKVIDSLVPLGLDEDDINRVHLDVYNNHFKIPFLEATEKYYKLKSEAFLAENSISGYLRKVGEWLREEESRVERYLNTEARKPLIDSCVHALIREHLELMYEASQRLLDQGRNEELLRMYEVLMRVPDDLEPLRSKFEEHVRGAGLTAVSRLIREGGAVTEVDLKSYIDALFEVHRKSSEKVKRIFKSEAGFVARLDKACREFVNKNAVTGGSGAKSLELLAKYVDALLRRGNTMAKEYLERTLDRVVVVFKYLEDKDVFQTLYTTKLCKRLIHNESVSEEAEASMISKLGEACGFEYTNQLQRMITDISLSRDLTNEFQERMAQDHHETDINFSIMALRANFWPLKAPESEFNIPADISSLYSRFSEYHRRKYSGRKLVWLWDHSSNKLSTNYFKQEYTLMTSSYQMAVLLQYNDRDTLTLDQLVTATAINKDVLMQDLAILVKTKILINKEKDRYDLNPDFESKRTRVDLNLAINAKVRAESAHILKAVNQDRKHTLEVTIYRIMKVRKTMKNQALIQEVISRTSQQFIPSIPDIKKAIDVQLEEEYIVRVEGTRDTFQFVHQIR